MIGVHNPILSRPNFLVSLSDDELTPAGLAARVVLTKVMHQLVEAGRWRAPSFTITKALFSTTS